MKNYFKTNYFVIPAITFGTLFLGRFFTTSGMSWYRTIKLPIYTPANWFFSGIWLAIFALITIAVLIIWNKFDRGLRFWAIITFLCINGALNVSWSYLFFYNHMMHQAMWNALAITLTVYILMLLIWPVSRITSLLFLPYAVWVTFATYLNFVIWQLN